MTHKRHRRWTEEHDTVIRLGVIMGCTDEAMAATLRMHHRPDCTADHVCDRRRKLGLRSAYRGRPKSDTNLRKRKR